jgi:hypothetical protein
MAKEPMTHRMATTTARMCCGTLSTWTKALMPKYWNSSSMT